MSSRPFIQQMKSDPKVVGGRNGKEPLAGFDSILLKAVDLALIELLGESGAAAVKFYADTSLVCKDPESFEQSLRKLFGGSQHGQGLIEKRIEESLSRVLWVEHSLRVPVDGEEKSLAEFVLVCRKNYNASKL